LALVAAMMNKENCFYNQYPKKEVFMIIAKVLFAGLFAVSVCTAQPINIRGKVTESSGITPLAGAMVRLAYIGLSTTTGTDGSFTLTNVTGISNATINKALSHTQIVSLHNGI
jgi:hypothetical protein